MAKRKINAKMLLLAGEDAHLQTKSKVSHANIDGESFVAIDVEKIKNNPMQPRMHIDKEELDDLMRSIKLHGLIQPISVIQVNDEKYILKAGQRRWLAHKALGLKSINAIVQEEKSLTTIESNKALFEIAVMENTHRENLNPLELALSLRQAIDKNLYKNREELAQALSKSKSYITKIMKVLSLEDTIIEDLRKNKSTNDIEALYEIQRIKDKKHQINIYFDFISKKIDRKKLREINKTKVSHANILKDYQWTKNTKKMTLSLDISKLDNQKRESISREIESLLGKYFD